MSDPGPEKPRRRPRYRGTHPRRFHEKYKEHQPERYESDVAKVLASGKTPAGMHRPIMVREILEILQPKPGQCVVDCTLGYGGHARELLTAIQPNGNLIALDVDPLELPKTARRLEDLGFPAETLRVHQMNYAGLAALLAKEAPAGADAILADLGLSSMQIDNPERGFTFKADGPLDLRMNPQRGRPASALINSLTEEQLTRLFEAHSDEPHAAVCARAICTARNVQPLDRTLALAQVLRTALPRGATDVEASIRRVFQALRIEVNDEFSALDAFLRNLPLCLKPGGRVAILTFHSGEDRRVKKSFQAGLRDSIYSAISEEVARPTPDEIHANPRASSAKLRWAERHSALC